MLADLEERLATVLGNALPAPFAGRVRVAPDAAVGPGPSVILGVRRVEPLPQDFGSVRPEAVPAPPERRRVVRLRCTIGILVEPQQANDREQVMAGVDALVYLLEDADFRSARALDAEGDQGFVLTSLALQEAYPGLRPNGEAPPQVTLQAEGWFWPVGTVGETGVAITEARVRQVNLPLGPAALPARIPAGGEPVLLRFTAGLTGTLRVRSTGPETDPFGGLAVRLLGEQGGPGAGSLAGGADGPASSRLLTVTDGVASVTYTPPAAPAVDRLVVHFVEAQEQVPALGLEIARFTLVVEAGS